MNEKTNAVNQGINPEKVTMIANSFADICHNENMIDVQSAILFFSATIYKAYAKNDPAILEEDAENLKNNFITFVKGMHDADMDDKH